MEPIDINSLVRPDRVHRRVYTDPDVFQLELELIFSKTWLYVVHESQIKNSGDYILAPMGQREVIVNRDENNKINVVNNSCAHRGAQLCKHQRGNRLVIVCPYHGWQYKNNGALSSLPQQQGYPDNFDILDEKNWLQRAPRVESYRGFVFASWADSGEGLSTFLGDMTLALDNLVDRSPEGEIEQIGGSFESVYPANWKLHMENANDTMHPSFVHASSVASGRMHAEPSAIEGDQTQTMLASNGFGPKEWESVELEATGQGHSFMGGFYKSGIIAPDSDDPVTIEYRKIMEQSYGKERTDEILGLDRFNNLIYPNLLVNAQFHQLRTVHPLSADRTLIRAFCFRLKAAPEKIHQRAVRFLTTLNSPASMIFSDDVEIFSRCQEGLSKSGNEWINVERGIVSDKIDENNNRFSPGASELPIRAQFAAWTNYMQGNVE